MKEIKGNLIEYISGDLIAINLDKVQSIYYSNNTSSITVNFGGEDYYIFNENVVTESSWHLLSAMLENL